MLTLVSPVRIEDSPTKGSRFIASAAQVATEQAARAFHERVADEFDDASHHCTAWRLHMPRIERCNDDGEPAGSAGRPMLAQLVGRDLIDVAVVVTRYFGGTKLGVGGLIRAYGRAASAALDHARTQPFVVTVTLRVQHGHRHIEPVHRACQRLGATIRSETFAADVERIVEIAEDRADVLAMALREACAGNIVVAHLDQSRTEGPA